MQEKLKKVFDKTFLTFIAVGVVNTLFGMTIMFFCYNILNLGYWFSSGMNYVCGSVLSYFLNKKFTFKVEETTKKSIIRFIINITVCYIIAYGIAKPLVLYLFAGLGERLQGNLALGAGMGLFVLLNYVGQRFWAFKQDKPTND